MLTHPAHHEGGNWLHPIALPGRGQTFAGCRERAKQAAPCLPEVRPITRFLRGPWTGLRRLLREPWSAEWVTTGLGVFGLVFMAAMTVAIAGKDYGVIDQEVRERAQGSTVLLADHAGRLFEVVDIALRTTALSLGARDWAEIESDEALRAEMQATADALPYIKDLWLNDGEGRLRLTTFAFPTPRSTIADRPIFKDLERPGAGLVIGDRIVGKVTGLPTFLIARRIDGDGSLRGIVSATTDLGYFADYWAGLALPYGERIALVRANGTVLVSYPDTQADRADDALAAAAADEATAGTFTPAPGMAGFYHRVGTLPLYVTVAFRESAILERWLSWFWRFVPFPLAAILAMGVMVALNRRRSRAEALARRIVDEARTALSLANQDLEERVAARTAHLRESNAEIQRFAYIVSHDLRAPLVNIMGFTAELQALREDLLAPGPPSADTVRDFDEATGFIRTSIDKMDRLINAILMLSRQGQRPFRPEPVDMDRLVRAVADSMAHRVQKAGATIEIGPLPDLVSDAIGIEQIVSNLVDNAVKYLQPDVAGRISVSGRREEASVVLRIEDNGRGIAAADHARVFDLFRRAGLQDQPGEGIGLAHVRALVRRLGGTVTLDSEPGRGSTFTVTLPSTLTGDPA